MDIFLADTLILELSSDHSLHSSVGGMNIYSEGKHVVCFYNTVSIIRNKEPKLLQLTCLGDQNDNNNRLSMVAFSKIAKQLKETLNHCLWVSDQWREYS